jgi:hypothetical protein
VRVRDHDQDRIDPIRTRAVSIRNSPDRAFNELTTQRAGTLVAGMPTMIRNKKPLHFRVESIRSLSETVLRDVIGGGINKCTGQWSGCETQNTGDNCPTCADTCNCTRLVDSNCRCA